MIHDWPEEDLTLLMAMISGQVGPQGPPGPGVTKPFWFTPNTSDVAGNYALSLVPPVSSTPTAFVQPLTGTAPILLHSFVTDPGVPGLYYIQPGSATIHFHASTGALNESARLLTEIYVCAADGTSPTLLRSFYSDSFSNGMREYEHSDSSATGVMINVTDRIMVKLYGARVAGPATVTLTLDYWATGVDSHLHFSAV